MKKINVLKTDPFTTSPVIQQMRLDMVALLLVVK
jgi:hypothetical protein